MTIEEEWKKVFCQINFKNATVIENFVSIKQNNTVIYSNIIFLSPKSCNY